MFQLAEAKNPSGITILNRNHDKTHGNDIELEASVKAVCKRTLIADAIYREIESVAAAPKQVLRLPSTVLI
ncbi:MAG: hypothetical protein CVV06_05295 [Gammaproteobacteria bacterium HGW-Gammaproteobacteria-10]|nr:MAG: hypothetical protein CVV06_05295 [Gammaproteobacteria bacterium HGW-Gammaproteobacteria-10]